MRKPKSRKGRNLGPLVVKFSSPGAAAILAVGSKVDLRLVKAKGYTFENALFEWEEGRRRLRALSEDPAARRRADRIVDAIREELRRRVGITFTAAELADCYGQGTEWCLQLAMEIAPGTADAQALADAAFWLHLQSASDFAGGRRLTV